MEEEEEGRGIRVLRAPTEDFEIQPLIDKACENYLKSNFKKLGLQIHKLKDSIQKIEKELRDMKNRE